MTAKALKILLKVQAKGTSWFVGIYTLVVVIIMILSLFADESDTSWILITNVYAPKIYLLVIGIVYPLIATKLYVSQGLTRKQFFWAYTGAISIISLFLLIPILASELYSSNLSPLLALTHYLQLPLFFLIGWMATIGFQMGKWNTSTFWLLSAIVIFQCLSSLPEFFSLSDIAVLGLVVGLLAILLLILPRAITKIPIKS